MLTAPEIKGIPLPRGLMFTPSPPPGPSTPRRKGPQYISLRILPRASYTKGKYPVTHTERNVFGTFPYSGRMKEMWKFKDEHVAYRSSENIFGCFEQYRDAEDFVGMDVCRKFLQMGRTRSMRYALRPGGKKYEQDESGEKVEMKRTGKVYDQSKLDGAKTFTRYEHMCWEDEVYRRMWIEWGGNESACKSSAAVGGHAAEAEEEEEIEGPPAKRTRRSTRTNKSTD